MKTLVSVLFLALASVLFSATIFGPVQYERTTGPPERGAEVIGII